MYFVIVAHGDHTRFVYGKSCSVTEISAVLSDADIQKLEHLLNIQYESGKRDAAEAINTLINDTIARSSSG